MTLLDPTEVYLVTSPPGKLNESLDFALGASDYKDNGQLRVRFAVAYGHGDKDHYDFPVHLVNDREVVEVQLANPRTVGPTLLRFEPLTYQRWKELGEQGWFPGYARKKKFVKDDGSLKQMLINVYLPDGWLEE